MNWDSYKETELAPTSCNRPNRTSLKYSDKVHQECHSLKVPECTRYLYQIAAHVDLFDLNPYAVYSVGKVHQLESFTAMSTTNIQIHSKPLWERSFGWKIILLWAMGDFTVVMRGQSGSIVPRLPRSRKVWVAHKVRMVDPQPILFLAGSFGYCWCQKCWLDVAISGWS